jgi:hypothetical protein
MSHQITATNFQAAAAAKSLDDLDKTVGDDGVDVVGDKGCSTVHVSRSQDEKGFYDVSINSELVKHLSKKQLEGMHFDRCAAPGAQASSSAPQLATNVVRHPTSGHKDRETVELKDFKAPGWQEGDEEACYQHAVDGANQTCAKNEDPVGGGGVIVYRKIARDITTNKDASAVAIEQIKAHVNAGKAVVAGVNITGYRHVVDKVKQPVTDHFVTIYGYETDAKGKVTTLLAKDNASPDAPTVRLDVRDDGSIVKKGVKPNEAKYVIEMEYQLSEVRFHTSMPYAGKLRPLNDAQDGMVWWPKKP